MGERNSNVDSEVETETPRQVPKEFHILEVYLANTQLIDLVFFVEIQVHTNSLTFKHVRILVVIAI